MKNKFKLNFKISDRTKVLGKVTLGLVGATIVSRYHDLYKMNKTKNRVIFTQSCYITDLEEFIIGLIGEDEFLKLVGEME